MNDKTKLVNLLKTVKLIFDERKIFFWIDYGTLWGAIRDKAIMKYDTDIDVGVWLEDVPKVSQTKNDFLRFGYDLKVNKGHLNYSLDDAKTGEPLGCILFRQKMDKYAVRVRFYPFLHILRLGNTNFGTKLVKNLWKIAISLRLYYDEETSAKLSDMGDFKKIIFYDEEHIIPEFPERYLAWMYGDDWTEEKSKDWVYYRRKERLKEVIKNEAI